jgi:endonuclease YncB( thermonuclease family)
MPTRPYVAPVVEVLRVVDGDTCWLRIDPGYRALLLINVRLLGFDCPERHKGSDHEKAEALRATSVATEFLAPVVPDLASTLWVRTEKDPDDFGRWLGDVWRESDTVDWPTRHLGDVLRSQGLASVWPTRWHDEFDHA